jgi:hypothetical protein
LYLGNLFITKAKNIPRLKWQSLELEVRSLQYYTDFFLSITPITLTIPDPVAVSDLSTANQLWEEKETYINIQDTVLQMHYSLGELPEMLTFRCNKKLTISEMKGQLFPSQLAILLTSFRNIQEQVEKNQINQIKSNKIKSIK